MTELIRPPSLRAFLDAGCDITTLPGWECLSESVFLYPPIDPAQRTEDASFLRDFAEAWLRGERMRLDEGSSRKPVDQDVVTRFLWEAECLEDPALVDRFEAALPAEKRADLLLISVELLWPEEEQ